MIGGFYTNEGGICHLDVTSVWDTSQKVLFALLPVAALEIFRRLQRVFARRASGRFCNFLNPKVVVVYPLFYVDDKPLRRDVARIEDVIAVHMLMSFLRHRGIECTFQDHEQDLPEGADVVLVCSPRGNKQSKSLQDHVRLPLRFEETKDRLPCVADDYGQQYLSPYHLDKTNIDLAVLGTYTSQNRDRRFFLMWGIMGVGTIGSVKAVTDSKTFRNLNLNKISDDFTLLLRVPYHNIRDVGELAAHTAPQSIQNAS